MTGPNRKDKLMRAKEIFTQPEDQELFATNEKELQKANDLLNLTDSPGGRQLIKELKDDIRINLENLFRSRNGADLSKLESNFNLLTKLTNAKSTAEAIESWIDTLEE